MVDDMDNVAARLEDRMASRINRGGKSSSRGGRSGHSGGQKREVQVSKALSRLLRHQAGNAGITLDGEGFARLDRVLEWGPLKSLSVNLAEVHAAVADNDKQRFAMKPNPATNPSLDTGATDPAAWLIRANQGHSIHIDSDALLTPISSPADAPPLVVHGTYVAFWPAIEASGGLSRMGRNHVHCATGLPGDGAGVVSGMRRDAEILVYVDVARSMSEGGLRWWVSENGVVLTEGDENGFVPARFFKEVVGRVAGVGVLWMDGEKVADIPADVRGRPPPGKQVGSRRGRGPRGGGQRGGGA